MNIYLIPYTMARHVVTALPVGGAALLAWWWTLWFIVAMGPVLHARGLWWSQAAEGAWFLANVATAVAFASVLFEGSLRRRALRWRFGFALLAAGIAFVGAWLAWAIWTPLLPLLGGQGMREVLADTSLVTLRYRLPLWIGAGLASGVGPLCARGLQRLLSERWGVAVDPHPPVGGWTWSLAGRSTFQHAGGAAAGSLLGAAAWHALGFYDWLQGDLYLAGAAGALVWGLGHGLLVWGIPDELYAGWVRVLSPERHGLRIPIPRADGSPAERFVGHFPRGLDLWLPADRGVAELHASFVVDEHHRYAVRGLSVEPTVVRRFLETIDLRYDPQRPAPLETSLRMEDQILLGPEGETRLEFLLLPKEEH